MSVLTIEEKKKLESGGKEGFVVIYNLLSALKYQVDFNKADLRESFNALERRIECLEKDSHVHITDTTIHKKEKK